ncbi:xanthine dehydrogenase family protein molybdopterin-binding subunit [Ensifer adhaerens]|jgi:xanthine dehydrogenase molybdenum-binding subunit|uniref:xanthine dehydrogenase family protein molybdopterin-binding subunit n=2 Tax=Sinorhizobium/Ensifer group TaxID=227292 RepID=UPI000712CC2A|nr:MULTISPECIES: xanthine dehydrogenase family protein molybdopterin-binding subunit [Ensifer]KSV73309.1 dehydrogenase [Sinorhizobium sp. GL2]MBD9560292.1 xanthine dehydrogenase family protein molybdopterin-binding subunit [Ensifer sp. ENS03]MBD9596665.1 xanthine dehydrogenase family protein molybdopterin-binding subunit [Ensifer sp. ENS05]MBD9626507.1 xanthine dehydrogenase family protein molybdopterin-binding subunit [Ensifer sp. ENS06]OWZ90646.1 dehydrogenase [Sinorhizobium sp. LM21]SFH185
MNMTTPIEQREFKIVGKSVKRDDVLEKVTGEAQYTGDIKLPGMLHGKIKRAAIAHARIKSIDVSKALAYPGVKAVLTHETVPRVLHYGSPHPRSASCTKDQYILDDKVRFWGEGVAAVAAISEEIADEALDLIEVEYEPLPAVFEPEDAAQPGAPLIHDVGPGGNLVLDPVRVNRGDIDKGFAEADFVLEGTFAGGRPHPAYMEPNVCIADWDGSNKLTFWTSTQTSFMVRGILAEVLGLPLTKVRVLVDHMGGGFGAKQDLFQHEFLCALLAKETRRPVKMEFTRHETFVAGRSRHPCRIWLKQGFKNDGTLVARDMKLVYDSGAYGSHGPGVTIVGTTAATSLYRCENVRLEGRCVYTNTPINGAFRGYGVVQSYYALDIQMDEAAERLGMDPAELKLKNVVRAGDIAPSGHPILGHGLEICLKHGIDVLDWKALWNRDRAPDPKRPHIRKGWGIGCEMHGSSAYPGIKEQGNATVKVNEDGTVTLLTGAAGLGTGAHTALAQIVAEELGVRFEDVGVIHGDTDVVPWDIGAFASHTTYLVGTAAKMAAGKVRAAVLARAAMKLQVSPDEIDLSEGKVFLIAEPDRSMTVSEAMGPSRGIPAANIVANGTYEPTKSYSFAAHFTEVDVDTETGIVEVKRVVPVHDVGRVIHPIAAQGQIEGGIQQGIGHTLTEDYVIDKKTGRSLNAGLVDYKMPLSMDMPDIETIILEAAPDPGGPWGAKGVGEDPIIAIGPSIANAIHDAIGVRFHHYPITPEDILKALREKGA